MNWAQRRQLAYIATVIILFLSVAGVYIYKLNNIPPTCFDGKKNGEEIGVDCGAQSVCKKYCAEELNQPIIRWVRTFPATKDSTDNIVHAIAYIEHGNPKAAAYTASYTFRLYDAFNTLITERKGTTFIGPMGKSAIVETLIPIGGTDPKTVRTTFSFDPLHWQKISSDFSLVVINTDRTFLERTETGTRLTATVQNQSRYSFRNMEIVAVLYDANNNAIAVSKAILPSLEGLENKNVAFTWGYQMPTQVMRIEVLPRFNPFTSKEL